MKNRCVMLVASALAMSLGGCANSGGLGPDPSIWDDGDVRVAGGSLLEIEVESITGSLQGTVLSPALMLGNRGEMRGQSAHFALSTAEEAVPTTIVMEPPELSLELDVCPIENFDGALTEDLREFAFLNVCVDGWCRQALGDELELEAIDTPEGRRVVARVSWDTENAVALQFRYTHSGESPADYERY